MLHSNHTQGIFLKILAAKAKLYLHNWCDQKKKYISFFTELNPATSLDTRVLLLDWKIWGQKLPTKTHYKEKWANNRSGKKALLNDFCSQVKENNFWFEGSEYFLNFLDYYCHNLSMHWQLVPLSLSGNFLDGILTTLGIPALYWGLG